MINQIKDFLEIIDNDFVIPLSKRVDLSKYAEKLVDKAIISAILDHDVILGLVAIYCNNYIQHSAYITLVATHPAARGHKLGRILMQNAINIARNKGFKMIGIHTENPIAIHLYESLGFNIIENSKRKYLELKL